LLRRLAANKSTLAAAATIGAVVTSLVAATFAHSMARRPRYGGTLRVEIGASFTKLDADPNAAASPSESAARDEINSLLYESRDNDGTFNGSQGSGPFRISDWQPGKTLALAANDKFPGGRPYLDGIEITMGRAAKDRLLDLELAKTDFAEIAPQDARHAAERGIRVSLSKPDELIALVFTRNPRDKTTTVLRQAVSLSIDRAAIANFILQKTGEPASGLLPQWASGTEFLFAQQAASATTSSSAAAATGAARAKELLSQIAAIPKLVLGYDAADPLAQAIAERIVVNAKESGVTITAQALPAGAAGHVSAISQSSVDAVIERVQLTSMSPAVDEDFAEAMRVAGIEPPAQPLKRTPQDTFDREREVLATFRIVPLEWVPQVYGLSPRVRDWTAPSPGETWPFADVWLDTATGNTAASNGQP
jgi:ABC-type transport system substrate-binding protein